MYRPRKRVRFRILLSGTGNISCCVKAIAAPYSKVWVVSVSIKLGI